jgi:prepilin-type N-terminal cleavage/methylation domain-containing protein
MNTASHSTKCRQQGFTLVEMAIVLLIVGLLLGGLLPILSSQVDQRHVSETSKQLDEIKEALIGYAVINGRLPCPAYSTGAESPATGTGICDHPYNGFVPAATLGLSGTDSSGFAVDSWGNRIRYAVTLWSSNTFTVPNGMRTKGISGLNPGSFSYLLVCSTSTGIDTSAPSCGATGNSITSSPGVPVIIFSTGKNGAQGGTTSSDEAENLSANRVFINHDFVQDSFDDIMIWISPNVLINRMVAAGKLP